MTNLYLEKIAASKLKKSLMSGAASESLAAKVSSKLKPQGVSDNAQKILQNMASKGYSQEKINSALQKQQGFAGSKQLNTALLGKQKVDQLSIQGSQNRAFGKQVASGQVKPVKTEVTRTLTPAKKGWMGLGATPERTVTTTNTVSHLGGSKSNVFAKQNERLAQGVAHNLGGNSILNKVKSMVPSSLGKAGKIGLGLGAVGLAGLGVKKMMTPAAQPSQNFEYPSGYGGYY